MRMKATILTVLAACTIGLMQARAESPADMAKKAYDEAAAWAAEVNGLVKQCTGVEAKLTAELGKIEDPAEKLALQKKLDALKVIIDDLRTAEIKAAAAAAAAQDALKRATAEGVSQADAEAAAGQAQRQARLGLAPRPGLLKALSKWVRSLQGTPYAQFLADIPIGGMTNNVPPVLNIEYKVNNLTTETPGVHEPKSLQPVADENEPGPSPTPTPTPVGQGRRLL